jgi:hypothetical protein
VWKIIGIIIGIVIGTPILIFILLAWYGFYLEGHGVTSGQSNITSTTSTLQFPEASYKDFSLAINSDDLNPAIANPNITEIGGSHLQILSDEDGYSKVSLPLMAIQLNIPFGWTSTGGFDALERIDFSPAGFLNTSTLISQVDFGVKVLDASGFSGTDFNSVMSQVQSIYDSSNQSTTTEVDQARKAFVIKDNTINNPSSTVSSSEWSIYIQDPNASSTVWMEIDMRAPKQKFAEYSGLLGLEYNDIDVNWAKLEALVYQSEQDNQ